MNRFIVGAFWTLFGIALCGKPIDRECVPTADGKDYNYQKDTSAFADPLYMWNCERYKPIRRTQGFRRPKVCIPGQQPGTCIIPIFDEPQSLASAAEMCLFQFGGRLAVAHDENSTTQWIQAIWRNADYSSAKTKRFWIGALVDSSGKGGSFFSVTDYRALRVLPKEQWRVRNACFKNEARLPRNRWPLANGLPRRAFQNAKSCPTWGVVLDVSPSDGRWHVEDASEKHGFLCEAPRWPKLDCGIGWFLIPEIFVCLKYLHVNALHDQCHEKCLAVGGKPASNNDKYRWYYFDITEPILAKPGFSNVMFFMGMHVQHVKNSNGYYSLDNLDGSEVYYESDDPSSVPVTTRIYCTTNGMAVALRYTTPDRTNSCLCQKMVDISGVPERWL